MQLEIEEAALSKETDPASAKRLEALRRELAEARNEADALRAQYEREKSAIGEIRAIRERIEETKRRIEEAERTYDLNLAAQLKHGELPKLTRELAQKEAELEKLFGGTRLLKEEVTPEEIAEIVSRWTGIPVSRIQEGERDKLLRLEEILHKRVVGQDEAVRLVSEAVLRARAGIKDPRRPIGSFLFLGPTGVGKTELAKALAEALFDSEDNMIRIDMSEYMEKHSVSRLIGAPPGYVGYDEGGQLTEQVRRKPYSVILFDEVEKAHPDVFNTLLQILDDGRVTDSHGKTVDFKNCVIILTSNVGSQHLSRCTDPMAFEEASKRAIDEVKSLFRPEFINRLDEMIVFKPLGKEEIGAIVEMLLGKVSERLKDRNMTLQWTPRAVEAIAHQGFDPVYGARPLKRAIQRMVETPLAKAILKGDLQEGGKVSLDAQGRELSFFFENPSEQ
jgi:ATP-dependent Clp protease ATP-binding subunit ClpB